MAVIGTLSSVNLIAGAGILGNVGGYPIAANTDQANAVSSYTSQTAVARFANIANTGYVSINVVSSTLPALTNAVPTAYQSSLGSGTLTSAVNSWSNTVLGNGDIGKFAQILAAAQSYVAQTNQLIKTTLNATDPTNTVGFGSQDSVATGGLSDISQAFASFGQDLANLGILIDLTNLNNLGSPAALLRQIATLTNPTPALTTALLDSGVPADVVENLADTEWTDRQQQLAYNAMTKITGEPLSQILGLLRITTAGIETMADLLNPRKLFPNSFNTLTAPTANGLRGIYINESGTVNSELETTLPASVLAPLQGNPLQNLPRNNV